MQGEQTDDDLALGTPKAANPEVDLILKLGFSIEGLVIQVNNLLKGLIVITYFTCVVKFTLTAYQCVSLLTLNDTFQAPNKPMYIAIMFSGCLIYLIRLHFIMKSGQQLGVRIKQSKRAFEDYCLAQGGSTQLKYQSSNIFFVLQQRLGIDCPIAPFYLFNVNSRTFFATLATVVTYLVILIKLRGAATSDSVSIVNGNPTTCLP